VGAGFGDVEDPDGLQLVDAGRLVGGDEVHHAQRDRGDQHRDEEDEHQDGPALGRAHRRGRPRVRPAAPRSSH
jgi:hypothetical protein